MYKDNVAKMDEEDRPEVAHHTVRNDLVSKAGEENLPGTIYEHNLGNIDPITAHTSYVTATTGFENAREEYGITNEFMEEEVGKEIQDETIITKFEEQPHKYKRLVAELVRSGAGHVKDFVANAWDKGSGMVKGAWNGAKSLFGKGKKMLNNGLRKGKKMLKSLFELGKKGGKAGLFKLKKLLRKIATS